MGITMVINFVAHAMRVLSQFGQDGVIKKAFDVIGTTNKYFVEFGSSGSDVGCGNTPHLRSYGFDGLLMDATTSPYEKPVIGKKYDVKTEFATRENICGLMEKYGVPKSFDFLSIDIDGNDYWVLERVLREYSPRVVCVEANPYIPIDRFRVQKYVPDFNWMGDNRFGASFLSMVSLGKSFGYVAVAICFCDVLFVKESCLPKGTVVANRDDVPGLLVGRPDADVHELSQEQMDIWDGWDESMEGTKGNPPSLGVEL